MTPGTLLVRFPAHSYDFSKSPYHPLSAQRTVKQRPANQTRDSSHSQRNLENISDAADHCSSLNDSAVLAGAGGTQPMLSGIKMGRRAEPPKVLKVGTDRQ